MYFYIYKCIRLYLYLCIHIQLYKGIYLHMNLYIYSNTHETYTYMHSTLYYSRRLIYKSCMLVRRYTYIISYAVHSHFLLANIIGLIYGYIYVYHTNIYIPSITIHTMHSYMYIIIPSTLHT